MRLQYHSKHRPGTIVPLLAVMMIGVFTLVALAIDIGLVALARTHTQNAADTGALAGVRQLNGDVASNNNYSAVAPAAVSAASSNKVMNTSITSSMVTTEIGYYSYNATQQKFVATFTGSKPTSESWTAVRVTVKASQPTFFAKVLGVSSLPTQAVASAVHRPRDVAIILDFSGSMKFSSEPAYPSSGDISGSLNPDPVFPKFGHYSAASVQSAMRRTSVYIDSGGETHAINNLTMDTDNGSAIVRDFLFRDPNNGNALTNAFHRPTTPYNPSVYACPAPSDWDVQSNTTVTYWNASGTGLGGDPAPRYNKSFTTGSYARNVYNFLTNNEPTYAQDHNKSTVTGPGGGQFDPATPSSPGDTNGYGANFKGYSIGPGYYGKTFFYWPPDPRFHPSANTTAVSTTNPAKDTSGRWMADWRKRFFYNGGSSTPLDGDNSRLWDTSTEQWKQASSTTYAVNYNAIIAWLKAGPQVLPPNLRAGRILYYSAIPDTIPSSGGTLDQQFWRAYIDYVIGNGSSTVQKQTGYGRQPDSDSSFGTTRITARSKINGADNVVGTADDPYMNYSDNPVRPRLQFWFGPLTMLCFLSDNNSSTFGRNWMPGTCHEAQCWQLKAGINSALEDIKKNHPNDWVSLNFFSDMSNYITERVTLGRDYARLKNALFFPFSTLDNLSNPNYEIRPYDSSFNSTTGGDVPNAAGGTSPECGFMVAYNLLSSRTGYNGRRGASKMVIFETDGVPNTTCNGSFTRGSPAPYNSYYTGISIGSYLGNGNSTVISRAKSAAQQICNLDTATNPGYSSTKNPARIHALAFGDLFETTSSTKNSALQFLVDIEKIGGTSPATASSLESYKIIVGTADTRLNNLRDAMQRIMQSGVQVALIQ